MQTPSQPSPASARWNSSRKFTVAVARQPIIVTEARADLLDRRAHRLLQVCEREVDWGYSKGYGRPILGHAKRCIRNAEVAAAEIEKFSSGRWENALSGSREKTLTIILV